ncbi:IS200/IS605 family transposase [Neolewinella persica]|uniref:IS200/IS605 family transposase n=1 Tax=Neolewinella persica TaxID=70998 RepID=UPI000476A448|nr:IS200/IS605 family transposase [Neolewinella persica]
MNSYHSTTYQIVFGTKYRRKVMTRKNRLKLFKFIYGICKNYECHVYRINGVSDHIHIVLSIPPKVAISALIKEIKSSSSGFIRKERLFKNWMGWQKGYFLGSYAAEARDNLVAYVKKQETHHGEMNELEKESYHDELVRLLGEHHIPWDEVYLE